MDKSIEEGRNPIILTERTSHIDILRDLMSNKDYEVVELSGNLKVKERKEALEKIKSPNEKLKIVIIATGKLIGEGFDLARLDTLFMAMPISWKGTIAQYAGRLHRESAGKQEVRIYDYIDVHISLTEKMYSKRLLAYRGVGYKIKSLDSKDTSKDGIYSGKTYYEKFIEDINAAKKMIILSSPFVLKSKYEQIKGELIHKFNAGLRVVICIKELEEYQERYVNFMVKMVSELHKEGVDIIQISNNQHKFAIIDDELIWYGGVNILGTNRQDESIVKITSGELGNELFGVLEEK